MELSGIGIGREAATGRVVRFARDPAVDEHRRALGSIDEERKALTAAIASSAATTRSDSASAHADTQAILEALLMIFEDDELRAMADAHLVVGWDAATALFLALDDLTEMMGDDGDFQSRVGDLRGLARGVSAQLRGLEQSTALPASGSWIVVAEDLTPVDTALFTEAVVGVVTELGGPTSHTAIICRSREIPAVVSASGAMSLEPGAWVLVDPAGNRVVPGADLGSATTPITFVPEHGQPLITVRANIGSLADAEAAASTAARGVGLFRTEVLYLNRESQPTMEEQATEFAAVFRAAPAGAIVVRTIDAGSDKPVPFLPNGREENPALGVRGFRLSHAHREFQLDQLEAIRAAIDATGRDVHVMAPMISTVREAVDFREMCRQSGLSTVGIMVETPAIVPMIPDLKGVVDFLSIGTNDLSQYLFAADRQHPSMGQLVNPWQPGLLRTIQTLVASATELNLPVGVCGESAADPLLAIVLAGLGVSSVSMAPSAVSTVWDALSSVDATDAQHVAMLALAETSANAARDAVANYLRS